MNKYILLEKIIVRIFKNYGYYPTLKDEYNKIKTKQLYSYFKKYENIDMIFDISNLFIYSSKIRKTISKINELNTINNIIFDIVKCNIKTFLDYYGLEDKLNSNINKNGSECSFNNTKAKDIYELLDKFKERNSSPFSVILDAFDWSKTREGHTFWEKTHRKYEIFILDLLFSEQI